MKNDNFYKTLRIVCLILAIVCMALSLFKKAQAAIPTDDYDNIISFINENGGNSTVLINNWNDINTTANYYVILPNTNGGSLIGYRIYFFQDDYIIPEGDSTGSNIKFYSWYFCYPANNIGGRQIYYDFIINSNNCLLRTCSWRNPAGSSFTYNNITYVENNGYEGNIVNNLTDSQAFRLNMNTISNYNCYSNLDTFGFCADNTNPYSTVDLSQYLITFNNQENNTDGFEVYKYGTLGSERLVCDFANCISISDAVGNSSTIQIDITIDGVDQTFNFDSSSTYYDYSVPYHIAKYSFPFSIFGINSETISAKLKGVKIVNTTSSPGGSGTKDIVWITPFTLVGSDYENLEPEVIPDAPDYTLNVNNQQYYEYIENKITSEWVEDVTQSDVHNYVDGNTLIVAYQRGFTWADWWNDWSGFFANVQDIPTYIFDNSPASTDEFKEKMMNFLKNNYGSLYFDTVIITWDPKNGELPLIYVWKTNLYQLKNTNSILKDMAEDLNISAFYTKQSYFDIKDRLDDFEDKTLTKFNELVGLQELENGFISSLQSILNQILNALLNLNIEFPEADYSDILSKLDTIIDNQDTSDINDDWYQNYREWLYSTNENDSYLSPHEYFHNIFGTLKTTFDSFTNNISFNAYLLKVEDFINHISGSTTDNLTIFLRDGIGDPGFNINNNYMYTVGGSQ